MAFSDADDKRMKYLLGYNGNPPFQILGPNGIESFDLLSLLARKDASEVVIADAIVNFYVANPLLIGAWQSLTQPQPPLSASSTPPQAPQ